MKNKIFLFTAFVLLLNSCQKTDTPLLSEQQIVVSGNGTTFYNDEDYLALLELSDTAKIYTITELKHSMNGMVVIFNKYKDRAGSFPTLYNVITNVAYNSLINSTSPYADDGKAFMNEFAKHYVRNLHSYLLGEAIEPAWQNYYQRVADNQNSILHLAMSGINAHITYDIPFVLLDIQAKDEFKLEFKEYTDFIAGAYPEAAAEMRLQYDVKNADEAFKIFGIGDFIDGIFGAGFTTHAVVDILRTESWQRGMDLMHEKRTVQQMHAICLQSFKEREGILQAGDDAKLLN
ncbi:MAG: hypothetical protein IPM95_00410 [Sphingobacteriales bacterium]|jgi:hypothetical protein|nr:hypothetical protein [Sphingobacteriales bacterium]